MEQNKYNSSYFGLTSFLGSISDDCNRSATFYHLDHISCHSFGTSWKVFRSSYKQYAAGMFFSNNSNYGTIDD